MQLVQARKIGWSLVVQLVRREIAGKYRGSVLGVTWSLLTPLVMLGIYTFVFGTVFSSRWRTNTGSPTAEFAMVLFAGLSVFQVFADVVSRAPGLVLANANYVKKVVFPLETLVPVALGSALFHAGINLLVLLAFILVLRGSIPITILLLPFVILPYCAMILGLAWFLASLGVFWRDVGQASGTMVAALMFLSPVFFPLSALPDWIRPWIVLNPVALPVEQIRNLILFATPPDWEALSLYTVVAAAVGWLGFTWFQKTRKGFADVL